MNNKKELISKEDIAKIVSYNIWQMPLSLCLLFLHIISRGNESLTMFLVISYSTIALFAVVGGFAYVCSGHYIVRRISKDISEFIYDCLHSNIKITLAGKIITCTNIFHGIVWIYCIAMSFQMM